MHTLRRKKFDDGPLRSRVIPIYKIPRVPRGWIPPLFIYRLYLFNCETRIESKYAILYRECGATFAHLLISLKSGSE